MKKLLVFVFSLLVCSMAFNACSDNETYADMLKDEKRAIAKFINDSNITVISQQQFVDQGYTTDVSKNEYVQTSSGVYMQIIDKGSSNPADTVKNNDMVLVRMAEYLITEASVTLYSSNLTLPYYVDEFRYTKSSSSISGIFTKGSIKDTYSTTAVPAGWLVPLAYVRDGARVKLIVPSKMGHETAMNYVRPYYYDIRKYQIYK